MAQFERPVEPYPSQSAISPQDQWPRFPEPDGPVAPIAYPRELSQPLLDGPARELYLPDDPTMPLLEKPSDQRIGFFQRIGFIGTAIPSLSDEGLGFSNLDAYVVVALPAPTTDWPLVITPEFMVHYLDGPQPPAPDLPPRIYEAMVQFRWLVKLSDWFMADLSLTPGGYGDFEIDDDRTFRLPGRGLAVIQWRPNTKLVIGALYTDRDDTKLLPAGGLIITHEAMEWELIFPRPKIAQRLFTHGWVEHWHYVAAEFGGGSYAIRRAAGFQDSVTIRDYRLMYGWERRSPGGLKAHVELGYVLGREIEYLSGSPGHEPDDTLLVRLGVAY